MAGCASQFHFLMLFDNAWIQTQGDKAWNTATGWRWMLGSEAFPALALMLLLIGAPESPRWLVEAGRVDAARRILVKLVGESEVDRPVPDLTEAQRVAIDWSRHAVFDLQRL